MVSDTDAELRGARVGQDMLVKWASIIVKIRTVRGRQGGIIIESIDGSVYRPYLFFFPFPFLLSMYFLLIQYSIDPISIPLNASAVEPNKAQDLLINECFYWS